MPAHAETPFNLSYSGRLTDAAGKPLDGPTKLQINFYRSVSGNDVVAVAPLVFDKLELKDGVFQVSLTLSAANYNTVFSESDSVWLEVKDLKSAKTYPRQRFGAVPYALKVPVDGSTITYDDDGQLTISVVGAVNGDYLKYDDGTHTWKPGFAAGAPGPTGLSGAVGPTGANGTNGNNGTNGSNGAIGPTGGVGATGQAAASGRLVRLEVSVRRAARAASAPRERPVELALPVERAPRVRPVAVARRVVLVDSAQPAALAATD